jgi:hypothetical protein
MNVKSAFLNSVI